MNKNSILKKNGTLKLNNKLFIGSGSQRHCYRHPEHDHLCIKIVAEATNSRRNQNKREHAYYKKLADKNIDWKHIASCHGWVKTNLGKGLVFDLVADHDNAPLPNLQEQLEEKNIDKEKLKFELKMLKKWIFEHAIIVADLKPENMIYISHKPKGLYW